MSDDSTNDIFPTTPRGSAEPKNRVLLEFGSFREFIDDYSAYISPEGMFLLDSEHRPGEEVGFEVRLSDDFRLIHGKGEIAWTVPPGTPGRRAGAALRFLDIDEPSRRLVARLVENHRSGGGTPFDITRKPETGVASEPPVEEGLPLSAALGTETIALPISLTGLGQEPDGESSDAGDLATPADEASPFEAVEPESAVESVEREAMSAEPPALGASSPPPSAPELPDLPQELPADTQPEPLEEVFATASPPPEVPSVDFEPADLSAVSELPTDEIEEALPVIPVEPDPLDAVDPAEPSVFDLVEEAIGRSDPAAGAEPESAATENVDDTTLEPDPLEFEIEAEPRPPSSEPELAAAEATTDLEAPTEPTEPEKSAEPAESRRTADEVEDSAEPSPVEMPDDEDLAPDFYRTSGPKRRGRTGLWVAVCLLAVLAGVAAWRFKDTLREYLPASLAGTSEETRTATVATDDPAVATEPPAPAGAPSARSAGRHRRGGPCRRAVGRRARAGG